MNEDYRPVIFYRPIFHTQNKTNKNKDNKIFLGRVNSFKKK